MGKKSELDIRGTMEDICVSNSIMPSKILLDLMTKAYMAGYDNAMTYVDEKMDEMTRRYKYE